MAQSYTANGTSIPAMAFPNWIFHSPDSQFRVQFLSQRLMRSGSVSGTPSERSVGRFGGIH
jgi:hypothetical protein